MDRAVKLVAYAHNLILSTGDKIMYSPITGNAQKQYKCDLFGVVGRQPAAALRAVLDVPVPKIDQAAPKLSTRKMAPTNCFMPLPKGSKAVQDDGRLEVGIDGENGVNDAIYTSSRLV